MNKFYLPGFTAALLTLAACASYAAPASAATPVNICGKAVDHIDVEKGSYDPLAVIYPDESVPNQPAWPNMRAQTKLPITIICYDDADEQSVREIPLTGKFADINNCVLKDKNMLCTR